MIDFGLLQIIRDYALEGRKRMDVGIIPPHLPLPEDNVDIQALKVSAFFLNLFYVCFVLSLLLVL